MPDTANDSKFRQGLEALGLEYVLGVQSTTSVWREGSVPLATRRYRGHGRPPKLLRRDFTHKPLLVRELAQRLSPMADRTVTWREATAGSLARALPPSGCAPAHRDYWRAVPTPNSGYSSSGPTPTPNLPGIGWPTLPPPLRLRSWSGLLSCAGESSATSWNSSRSWGSTISRPFLPWIPPSCHAPHCRHGFVVAERCAFPPGGRLRCKTIRAPRHFRSRGAPVQATAP